MGTYILRRLMLMIPTLVGVTLLVFLLLAASPGGIGAGFGGGDDQDTLTSESARRRRLYVEDRYGVADPVLLQYGRWLASVLPIKFGARNQVMPDGDVVRWPRGIDAPPLAAWFSAPPSAGRGPLPEVPDKVTRYRQAESNCQRARLDYLEALETLRRATDAYAAASRTPGAIDRHARANIAVLGRGSPDMAAREWPALKAAGDAAMAGYEQAGGAREKLIAAIEAEPFGKAGVPLIPGALSMAWPDLGESIGLRRPVTTVLSERLPVTLSMNAIAVVIVYGIAIPTGVLAAVRRGRWFDKLTGLLFLALWSVPVVWAAAMAVGYLASREGLGWFPVSGLHDSASSGFAFWPGRDAGGVWQRGWAVDSLWHLCLPVLCLSYAGLATLSRFARAAVLENLSSDYVRTARAKGVPEKRVLTRHVLRNSLLPLITIFVTILPALFGGSVVVERAFSIRGMGSLMIEAIEAGDRELLLGTTLLLATVNVVAVLLADVLYAWADPRIRLG